MNGPILGNAGAIFIAGFCARLAEIFGSKAEELGSDPSEFNQEAFSAALTEALTEYAHMDCT